jgi:hypothetical protein
MAGCFVRKRLERTIERTIERLVLFRASKQRHLTSKLQRLTTLMLETFRFDGR